jgi:hypothetical protein
MASATYPTRSDLTAHSWSDTFGAVEPISKARADPAVVPIHPSLDNRNAEGWNVVADAWLPEPDDVQDRQAVEGPVDPEGDRELANHRVADVLAFVVGVELPEPHGSAAAAARMPRTVSAACSGRASRTLAAGAETRTAYGDGLNSDGGGAPPGRRRRCRRNRRRRTHRRPERARRGPASPGRPRTTRPG